MQMTTKTNYRVKLVTAIFAIILAALGTLYLLFVSLAERQSETGWFGSLKEEDMQTLYRTKTILILVPSWGYDFLMGRTGFINGGCPVSNCMLTKNESLLAESEYDAVIMHIPSFKAHWASRQRNDHQMYIFFTNEVPGMYKMPTNVTHFDGFFNRTMTHMSGSDFYFPYGRIEPLASAPRTEAERLAMMHNVRQSGYNPAARKSKTVAVMYSNCDVSSNRQLYVALMQRYMDVDIISHGIFIF